MSLKIALSTSCILILMVSISVISFQRVSATPENRMSRSVLTDVGLVAVFASVYGQTETQTENTDVKTVTIVQGAQFEDHPGPDYNPPVITVKPGDKVMWKNEDYPDN